jgi:hypothetical protein
MTSGQNSLTIYVETGNVEVSTPGVVIYGAYGSDITVEIGPSRGAADVAATRTFGTEVSPTRSSGWSAGVSRIKWTIGGCRLRSSADVVFATRGSAGIGDTRVQRGR